MQVVRGLLAGIIVAALSGCVSIPDAIKGSSPTPQQDLVRVMAAPQLYVGQESRFGGKVVNVQNQQESLALKSRPSPSTAVRDQPWVNRPAGEFTLISTASSILSISVANW